MFEERSRRRNVNRDVVFGVESTTKVSFVDSFINPGDEC